MLEGGSWNQESPEFIQESVKAPQEFSEVADIVVRKMKEVKYEK